MPPEDIESFIRLYGSTKRSWLRAGYGFTRNRDGAANMHAVSCLPAVTGAWAQPGGGALNSMGGAFSGLDRRLLDGPEHSARTLDLCRIGRHGGPPVSVMLVQNANPATIAPDSDWVRGELTRDDLTLIVHEQVMTATAQLADLVFPATTFLEHADLYASYGHGFLQRAKPVIAPVGEARSNHRFIAGLATRLGLDDPSTRMDEEAMIDAVLAASGLDFGGATWLDLSPDFDAAHFRHGFGHPDGRFHFATPWSDLPDHHGTIDAPTPDRPLRLITPPSIHFLNSTFGDSPTQRRLAGRPTVDIHPADALGVFDGDVVRLGNDRASVRLHARVTETVAPGVVSVEGLWPGDAFLDGIGINRLTSSDSIAPNGGAPYHDTAVWLKRDP